MRKILSFAMAAVLLVAGCAKEDSFSAGNESVEVIFTADLPIQTEVVRAGEANLPQEIVYVVYNEAKTKLKDGTLTVQNKTARLTLDLIKGETYNIAFWAQVPVAPFTFDKDAATIKADYSNVSASDEALDAFYAVVPEFVVSGPVTQSVKLTRPFAQVNLGVPQSELDNAAALGVNIDQAQISVTNVATKLDLFTGKVSEPEDVTFKMAALPAETLTVENEDYTYLAYTYLLVEDTDATDLTYQVADGTKNVKANTVPAVNYKRNYRTNILGRLITSEAGFDITIEPGDLPDHESIKYQSVSTASGLQTAINDPDVDHIVLQGDIDLNDLLSLSTRAAGEVGLTIAKGVEKTIDLGGFTLSWANDVLNSSMIQNNGTLTIQNGNVVYTYEGAGDPNYGAGNYAISNSGKLTVDANITIKASQKAEGEKMSHAMYAIQTNGDVTINGGKIYNHNNIAVRIFANVSPASLTINDGELKGVRAIWLQLPSNNASVAPEVEVNINGGKFTSVGESGGYKLAIYSYSYGNSFENVTLNIAGGEFDGDVALTGATNKTGVETVNISGGKFLGDVYSYADDAVAAEAITITGGEFSSMGYVMNYIDSADEVFTLGEDMALESTLTISKDFTLDLNGYTMSGVCNAGQGHLIMVNNGATLNVKDSSAEADGKITFAKGSSDTGWTIDLEGELNLYSGTIELTGDEWSIGYAVDVRPNAWGTAYTEPTTFNMYGGKLLSSDGAVRVASSSSESYKNVSANFNMEGGEIEAAWDGLFIQQSNATYDVLNVNISGGKISSTGLYPVRIYGPVATAKVGDSKINIAGCELNGVVDPAREALVENIICLGGGVTAQTLYHTEVEVDGAVVLAAQAPASAE